MRSRSGNVAAPTAELPLRCHREAIDPTITSRAANARSGTVLAAYVYACAAPGRRVISNPMSAIARGTWPGVAHLGLARNRGARPIVAGIRLTSASELTLCIGSGERVVVVDPRTGGSMIGDAVFVRQVVDDIRIRTLRALIGQGGLCQCHHTTAPIVPRSWTDAINGIYWRAVGSRRHAQERAPLFGASTGKRSFGNLGADFVRTCQAVALVVSEITAKTVIGSTQSNHSRLTRDKEAELLLSRRRARV